MQYGEMDFCRTLYTAEPLSDTSAFCGTCDRRFYKNNVLPGNILVQYTWPFLRLW